MLAINKGSVVFCVSIYGLGSYALTLLDPLASMWYASV